MSEEEEEEEGQVLTIQESSNDPKKEQEEKKKGEAPKKTPEEGKKVPEKQIPFYMKFVLGGTAGMIASTVVQPVDLVKTRMQISAGEYKSSLDCAATVLKKEGILTFYNGVGAALLRQATYTTGRLGVYTYLNEQYKIHYPEKSAPLGAQMLMAVLAGSTGAIIGTPAEVALIRMTADGRLPPAQRRNYKNVFNALSRIYKEEGITALWRGCVPTVGRAMVVNVAQLSSYSQSKNMFMNMFKSGPDLKVQLCAAGTSGLLTTLTSLPVDIAKTKIQNMRYIDGKPEYSGAIDVILKTVKNEGLPALWKGFTPYFFRIAPHTVLTFICLEKISGMYNHYVLGKTGGSSM